MKKTERFKSSKSQPQVSNSCKKTNVSSTCMNRSKTAGKKEVKIAFCSAQAHSHLEEESVTAGVTLQDKENQNLHLEGSDQNGEMSENMSHQSDRSNCDNLLTLISKSSQELSWRREFQVQFLIWRARETDCNSVSGKTCQQ